MLQRYDYRRKPEGRRGWSDQITPLVAINGIVILVLVNLALNAPSASEWISAAAQAEYVGDGAASGTPPQIAEPIAAIKVVQSN